MATQALGKKDTARLNELLKLQMEYREFAGIPCSCCQFYKNDGETYKCYLIPVAELDTKKGGTCKHAKLSF